MTFIPLNLKKLPLLFTITVTLYFSTTFLHDNVLYLKQTNKKNPIYGQCWNACIEGEELSTASSKKKKLTWTKSYFFGLWTSMHSIIKVFSFYCVKNELWASSCEVWPNSMCNNTDVTPVNLILKCKHRQLVIVNVFALWTVGQN